MNPGISRKPMLVGKVIHPGGRHVDYRHMVIGRKNVKEFNEKCKNSWLFLLPFSPCTVSRGIGRAKALYLPTDRAIS